jgi:PAS domain S-box-containing protein
MPVEILESMTDGVIGLDGDWRITYVNGATERIHRRTREALLGRTLWEALPAVMGTDFERELRRAMSERVPIRRDAFDDAHGSWFEMDVHPLLDGGLAWHARDITEHKRAHEQLKTMKSAFGVTSSSVSSV